MSARERAVVVGASGGVGRFLVKTLAKDSRVEIVTAIVRKKREEAVIKSFYLLDGDPEGDEAIKKVQEQQISYDELTDEPTEAGIFQGHTIGFSGLAIYTADATSEEHFRQVEITYNLRAAKMMKLGGVHSYSYLSGMGASQKPPGLFTPLFSKVKGEAERRLQTEVGFERANVVRPPGIFDRPADSKPANKLESFLNKNMRFILNTNLGVTAEGLAQAMVHSALSRKNTDVWEPPQIKIAQQEYLQDMMLLKKNQTSSASSN